jgi:putative SOS response-associated peptidase YedK
MCGRYTLFVDPADLQALFPDVVIAAELSPRYNIAPSQPVAVIANNDPRRIVFFRWGLVPSWAQDPSIGSRLINARAETLAQKLAFRAAYRSRRCLVLADGFYEWRKEGGRKQPFYVRLRSGKPFAFAGLWESWRSPQDETLLSCAIITTDANELLSPIHDRMPVILDPAAYDLWLDPAARSPIDLQKWLRPYPAAEMVAYAVSPRVNNPDNEGPENLKPET